MNEKSLAKLIADQISRLYKFCEAHRLPHHKYSYLYDPPSAQLATYEHLSKLQHARLDAWRSAGSPIFEKPKLNSER